MQRPFAKSGLFEFHGSKTLEDIGLSEKFFFEAPDKFSLDPRESKTGRVQTVKGIYQQLLALYLKKSIQMGELVSQESD
jgi:hypothetical protein